jgi:hypothetical protein
LSFAWENGRMTPLRRNGLDTDPVGSWFRSNDTNTAHRNWDTAFKINHSTSGTKFKQVFQTATNTSPADP